MQLDIIGIGSALVDITINTDDCFLDKESLPKGSMTLIDHNRLTTLLSYFSESQKITSPGGATSNVIASFCNCGGKAGFIGKIGIDDTGVFFDNELKKIGVYFEKLETDQLNTGTVLTFITDDGERTFATYLGAASSMSCSDLSFEILNQAPILHVEAYLIFNKELMSYIFEAASHNKQKISFDLSSFNIVEENLKYFQNIITDKIDIVFANEEESYAFTKLNAKEAFQSLSSLCHTAVVKEGANGSQISIGNEQLFLPSEHVKLIDTNGAGDAYAGGILYGISQNLPINKILKIGTKAGALAVSQQGARLSEINIQNLHNFCQELC